MSERQGRYAVRVDANQREIAKGLEKEGYLTFDTHALGKGFPDLAVNAHGRIVLLEIKTPDGTMTTDETKFHLLWHDCPVHVVYSLAEALEVVRGEL